MTQTQQPGDEIYVTAQRWLAAEPDADVRGELEELMAGDPSVLRARFDGRLHFGTAGLRAAIGAGPLRMNRLMRRRPPGSPTTSSGSTRPRPRGAS